MARQRILVVEDEEDIAELIEYNLLKNDFSVTVAHSGEEALSQVRRNFPDLILLDLMLPGEDGLEICRKLKSQETFRAIPIVMVTAKAEESDIVTGLEQGAEDYIVKPFSPKVLLARVRAVLRRGAPEEPSETAAIQDEGLEIVPGKREVCLLGAPVKLTFTEFNILLLLARRRGWVFTRSQISDSVRGDQYHVTERSVDVHIRALRKKLGSGAGLIETVRGVGYRFRG
jgi:two-component system alkaline phosphatase synthesis response regulator PhoP